jgi:hypothetical protein
VSIDPSELERLNRDELIAKARQLGAKRPELLTRPELRDEIIRLSESDDNERRRARGWFGVARDLVASVVSQGLNLPDTADLIRGVHVVVPRSGPPVATVTLAEIYAAQGHTKKALDLLDEVLAKEPDHEAARHARDRWASDVGRVTDGRRVVIAANETQEAANPGEESEIVEDVATDEAPDDAPDDALDATPDEAPDVSEASTESAIAERPPIEDGANVAVGTIEGSTVSDEPPLRIETEVDRLWVVRRAGKGILVHWQVANKTLKQLKQREPEGAFAVRWIEVARSWDGPVTSERTIVVEAQNGHCEVTPDTSDREIRAALGWLVADRFVVVAMGVEFDWDDSIGPTLRWAPPATLQRELWQSAGSSVVTRLMRGLDAA